MADVESPTNNIENAPLRNESNTSGNKRQVLDSPTQASPEGLLSKDDVREIIQEVMKAGLSLILSKFEETMNAILNKVFQPINAKIDAMVDSIKFVNSQYENLLIEHITFKKTIKDLQTENSELKDNINSLKVLLNQLGQPNRSSNVEIHSLPEKKHVNICNNVSELSKEVGCVVGNRDICHGSRVSKLNPDNIGRSKVVQFAPPRIRDRFISSTLDNKNNKENKLKSTHLDYSGSKPTIYVTAHLSPIYKALHAAARVKARELGYKFVWIRGGRIFVRKEQDSENILIRNMDTLNKLV